MELNKAKIHFIGIGGIGMSGIAEVLVNMGCAVTGSDKALNAQTENLQNLGAEIFLGHKRENVPAQCHAVVYSSAVTAQNPEILEAKSRKIPILQRAEMLSELMGLKRGIAVGGTHGKTSTTSMAATMMIQAGLDPTVVIGGRLDLIKSSAKLGQGEWLLAEADESDGSFLRLSPEITIVTNIDDDHLDHYKSLGNLQKAFKQFVEHIPFYGCSILCADDPMVLKLSKAVSKRVLLYGFSKAAQLRAESLVFEGGFQRFDVTLNEFPLGRFELRVPGRHNVLNALAAIGVGLELGMNLEKMRGGLRHYSGVDRRLQKIGEINHVQIYDDYGHHPTEVRATLQALRELHPKARLVVLFQPHRFTRTQKCWKDFLTCFKDADYLGLIDIYPASERPIKGITSKRLAEAIARKQKKKGQSVNYIGRVQSGQKILDRVLAPGDVLLTLGAGDIYKVGPAYLKFHGEKQ